MPASLRHHDVEQSLVTAFALVGAVMWVSYLISRHLTLGRGAPSRGQAARSGGAFRGFRRRETACCAT